MGKALIIIIVGFSTIFGSIMFKMTTSIQQSSNKILNQYYSLIRRNTAESATNVAISRLYQDIDWRTGFTNLSFTGAHYSVSITDITADSTTEAKKIQVTTITDYESLIDTSIAIFMQPAYSYFYYYSKKWPSHLVYESGDTLLGPIHSNERIQMSGSPVFTWKVSSKKDTYMDMGGANPKFYGGADFGTNDITLPNLNALKDSAFAGGDIYNEELWLTFNSDGSYQCSTSTILTTKLISNYNGTIMTTNDKHIHVQGAVNGKATVISDKNIFIENDIVYASDPTLNPNSDDYIGLVADNDLIIVDNAANSMDVVIQAAILIKGKMKVEHYDTGVPRGTLTILGSIGQNDANPFGTFDAGGGLQTGYEINHSYDVRLLDKTPPFFPRLNRIEKLFRSS